MSGCFASADDAADGFALLIRLRPCVNNKQHYIPDETNRLPAVLL